MEVLVAYLACVILSLFAVRLGVPEAIHTLNDRRHDACLARIADLEEWHGFTTERGAVGEADLDRRIADASRAAGTATRPALPAPPTGDISAQVAANRKRMVDLDRYTRGQQGGSQAVEWAARRLSGRHDKRS